jgi:hypothetical protein
MRIGRHVHQNANWETKPWAFLNLSHMRAGSALHTRLFDLIRRKKAAAQRANEHPATNRPIPADKNNG